MLLTEDTTPENTKQEFVVFLDGCPDIYEDVCATFAKYFRIERVDLSEADRLKDQAPLPDAVVLIVGKSQYPQAFAWIKAVRQHPEWQNIPLIPYINQSADDFTLQFLEVGATECWVYPITYQRMVAQLQPLLRVKLQFDAQKAQLEAFQKNYLKQSQLIEIGAHDLQHPLAELLMIQDLMRQYDPKSAQVVQLLNDMTTALNTMREILDDFLTAVSLRGAIHLKPALLPVADVLYDIGLKYAMRGSAKNIQVLVGQTPGMVYADPRRLAQAVENLVSNAVKYSPPEKEVHIWSEVAPEGTYIRVRDWGMGIPEVERDLLFSEFGKLSPRPTGNESSVGLGLWVVKTLCKAMNGDAGATFPEVGGSIFWIRLPAYPPE